MNLAALAGAIAGWQAGVAAGLLSLASNLIARRPIRLPEPLIFPLWLLALVAAAAGVTVPPLDAIAGSLVAAGAAAIAGAVYWWIAEVSGKVEPGAAPSDNEGRVATAGDLASVDDDEPVAMGFGDVKLAAVLGAMLGWEKLLLAVFLSFLIGAVGGVIGRVVGGERVVPFGPYLVIAAFVALFLGDAIIGWYVGLLAI